MEVLKKRRYSKGWLVYVKQATSCCFQTRKVLQFEQEEEPTLEQIKEEYENRNKR